MKIAGCNVDIVESDCPDLPYLGQVQMGLNLITINKHLKGGTKEEVILHEVLEHICANCDIRIKHQDLSVLSVMLHQVLVDNGGNIKKWR